MNPIQRVNVDFTAEMLREVDEEATGLNISRQAVIKTLVREGLDRYSRRESPGEKSARLRGSRTSCFGLDECQLWLLARALTLLDASITLKSLHTETHRETHG